MPVADSSGRVIHISIGEPAVIELMLDGLNPILTTDEADRLVGWHLGVSL